MPFYFLFLQIPGQSLLSRSFLRNNNSNGNGELCQTMPFLVLCLVLTILNSFFFHVKVRFFQDIDIQDDAIGNMLVKFPSLLTCSPYKKIWPVVCLFLISFNFPQRGHLNCMFICLSFPQWLLPSHPHQRQFFILC